MGHPQPTAFGVPSETERSITLTFSPNNIVSCVDGNYTITSVTYHYAEFIPDTDGEPYESVGFRGFRMNAKGDRDGRTATSIVTGYPGGVYEAWRDHGRKVLAAMPGWTPKGMDVTAP